MKTTISKYSFILLLMLASTIVWSACEEDSDTPDQMIDNPAPVDTTPVTLEYKLVWEDNFDGDALDTTSWSYQIGTGGAYGLDRWGNNELQYYTDRAENVRLEDGNLIITALKEDFNGSEFTSTRIRTKDKADWTFGRFEIRAKLPKGQGLWPAIWMLSTDERFGEWPKSGEIDIMEIVGHEPEKLHGTIHYGPAWPNNKQASGIYTKPSGDFSEEFHVYSIEWKVNEIAWFIDGQQYHKIDKNRISPDPYPFNEKFHLLLNVAVGGNWPGNPDDTTVFPQTMEIDYIKVYQLQ